jgi:hypothetical protein
MSRSAARAFMAGRGGADGLGLAPDLRLGAGPLGLALGAGDALVPTGDGSLAGGLGGVGEHPMRTTRQSAATARRIPRPYVAGEQPLTRASERPSGSQDAVRRQIGLPIQGSYCYGVRIAGILLVRQRVG